MVPTTVDFLVLVSNIARSFGILYGINGYTFISVKTYSNTTHYMSRANSVASISSGSESEANNTGYFNQWVSQTEEVAYNLCGKIPKFQVITVISFIVENLGMIALSIDPKFSWNPDTRSVLSYIALLRGPSAQLFNYPTMIILVAIVNCILFLYIIIGWWLQRYPEAKSWIFSCVALWTTICFRTLYIPILTTLLVPMRCNFTTGFHVDYPTRHCVDVPNVILMIISGITVSMYLLISFLVALL